jgi:cation diffusion facilitator family transporter
MAQEPEPENTGRNMHATKQRTLLVGLILDIISLIPAIVAAILAGSIVLYADAIKATNEVLATFLSYLTLRKMGAGGAGAYDYGVGKFETFASLITGGVMFISLAFVIIMAMYRIAVPSEIVLEGALLGIFFLILGGSKNVWLWMKNLRLYRISPSPILHSQWRLYRTKALSDFFVLLSVVATLALSSYAWSLYIDPLSSFIIAGVIVTSGYRIFSSSLPALLDKTLDEELQMVIIQNLAEFFDEYTALHGVRSRRSGHSIYIELFLEFEGTRPMSEVQDSIDRIRTSLESRIPESIVSIIPSREPPLKKSEK